MDEQVTRFRNQGSASVLVGQQKLIAIFVDDLGAEPWTHTERKMIESKINQALRWLENHAEQYRIHLNIQHICLPGSASTGCQIDRYIDEKDQRAGPGHSAWQNCVVAKLTTKRSVSEGWFELFEDCELTLDMADGSSILFFVKRNGVSSIAFPYFSTENTEFERERGIIFDMGGITTGQTYLESQIVHELLHLYGAVDLASHKAPKILQPLAHKYVKDVMHTPNHELLVEYEISDLTAFLIGWTSKLPKILDKDGTSL